MIDKIDESIIRSLIRNARKPFLKIAKELALSPVTVQRRYEKMKANGVFFGSASIFDLSVIGFSGKAFLFIKLEKSSKKVKVLDNLKRIKNLFSVVEIVGEYELFAMAVYRGTSEIKEIIDDVRSLPQISQVELALTDDCFFPLKPEFAEIDPF